MYLGTLAGRAILSRLVERLRIGAVTLPQLYLKSLVQIQLPDDVFESCSSSSVPSDWYLVYKPFMYIQ